MKRREFIKTSAALAAIGLTIPKITLASMTSKPTLYFGGPILTMNATNDIVEAMVVEDGKLLPQVQKRTCSKEQANISRNLI